MKHAIVLGEGFAALAASERLRSAGLRVTRLALEDDAGATDSELQLVCERHSALDWLAKSLGAPSPLEFARLSRVAVARRDGPSRIVSLTGRGLLGLGRGLGLTDAWRHSRLRSLHSWFGPALDPAAPERGVRLDDRSVADFARVYLARPETRDLLAAILEAGLGLDDRDLSRLLLFLRLDELDRLTLVRARGMERLAAALAAANPLVSSSTVTSLASGCFRVQLSDGSSLEADAGVLCAPPSRVRKRLSELPQRADSMLARLSETVVWEASLSLDREVSLPADFWVCPRALGGSLAGIVKLGEARILALGRPGLDRAAEGDAKRIKDSLVRSVRRALPSLESAQVQARAHRRRHASFAPGHWRAVATLHEEEARWLASRGWALAGSWQVSPDVEGQARSGLLAAERLLGR